MIFFESRLEPAYFMGVPRAGPTPGQNPSDLLWVRRPKLVQASFWIRRRELHELLSEFCILLPELFDFGGFCLIQVLVVVRFDPYTQPEWATGRIREGIQITLRDRLAFVVRNNSSIPSKGSSFR